jgi:C-terminal processing protease CtpA/Prc
MVLEENMKEKNSIKPTTRIHRERKEVPAKHPKTSALRRQRAEKEERKHARARVKLPAYLKKLDTAVREHFAKAMTLPTFLETAGTLTPEDRKLLVRQALILIEQNYVHLPLKRAMHSIDPIQRLKLLLQELEQTPAMSLPSEVTFHREMTEIFTSLRDLHTNYLLPAPFSWMVAFLPFIVEDYVENGKRKYIVSHITPGFITQPTFVVGVEVLFWNGIPIERAVLNNAQRYAGSNREAQHARGVENLTTRSLYTALPPDEAWVFVGYQTTAGKLEEIRIDWIVNPALPSGAGIGSGEKGDLGALAAMGLDLGRHLIQQMRKTLFAPQVVAAEKKIAEKSVQGAGGKPLGKFESTMPNFFSARPVTTPSGTFGYLRIWTFATWPKYSTDQFVNEFIRLVSILPQNGLIIDVRGNGGGIIWNGEEILQVLTPRRIEPEPVQFINTPLNLRICQQNGWLNQWVESIQQSLQTGAVFSAGFPLTDPELCNAIGQKYFGPVVLITNAQCYSTTDFFAAGFQDHEIGPVLGADDNTGAGGANVWEHEFLRGLLPEAESVYRPLPNGAGMSVAIRRSLRVGRRAGMPVEDLGVIPDERHFMTKNDLLNDNVDLINKAGSMLAAKQPARAFTLTLQSLPPRTTNIVENNRVQGIVNTKGMTRLDIYLNDRPLQSIDVQEGQTIFILNTKPSPLMQTLEIRGFDGSELVARYRTNIE